MGGEGGVEALNLPCSTTSFQGVSLAHAGVKFGVMTIVKGQTARLSVVNSLPPLRDSPDCVGILRFKDANGTVIASRRVTLPPQHADFLDVSFEALSHGGDTHRSRSWRRWR